MPSNVCAKKWLTAHDNHTHAGTGGHTDHGGESLDAQKSLSYMVNNKQFATVNKNPVNVKTFGASHDGTIYWFNNYHNYV